MKLAISNIAWPQEEEPAVAALLASRGVTGIEIAPTAVWPAPLETDRHRLHEYRTRWAAAGVEIVAMQALLYGQAHLTIFDDAATRAATLGYLSGMIGVAAALGARILVFGSPRNRKIGGRPPSEALAIAVPFFRTVGERAADQGVTFCIEPNPSVYDCDFVTSVADGVALTDAVDHPGFGLHLDAGAMTLNGEAAAAAVTPACARRLRHFHVSEPYLAPVGGGAVDHRPFAAALRDVDYAGWMSIEMRSPKSGSALTPIAAAITAARAAWDVPVPAQD